eukprot:14878975-Ditylum_brightwellii.AAC.1
MQHLIFSLLHNGFIKESTEGEWLSRATLEPKLHQEAMTSIDNFIWCFFVNYIPLNQIAQLIMYPIPRCNDTVSVAFGKQYYTYCLALFLVTIR